MSDESELTVEQKAEAWDVLRSMAEKEPRDKKETAIRLVLKMSMDVAAKLVVAGLGKMMARGLAEQPNGTKPRKKG